MRVLQVSATNGFAENRHPTSTTTTTSSLRSNHLTELTSSSSSSSSSPSTETFGNNNENDRTHPNLNPNSNLEHFTNNSRTSTTSNANANSTSIPISALASSGCGIGIGIGNVIGTVPNTSSSSSYSSHQLQNSHNCKISGGATTTTTNPTSTTTTSLERNLCDGSVIDSSNNGTTLEEHQHQHHHLNQNQKNSINKTSAPLEAVVVDSLQNVSSSNYSFFEDCVNEFANLESYRRTSMQNTADTFTGQLLDRTKSASVQKEENQSLNCSGQSSPSFEEIHLDNFALERELNRIIRGTSISEACEDDNSCNCKSLQESLKSYELIRDNNLPKNDDNVSIDDNDDDDYDDDQMDPHHNAESITRISELSPDDDSLMDDDDEEYLSSQASSCTSVSTPQRSHFPRGIINPNYPGFQHLAHTLSEHYISHQSSDPYDSDLSEYEMELSVDSFECEFLDGGSSSIGSNIMHNNNNNLNTVMVINNNLIDSKTVVAMDDSEDNFNRHLLTTTDDVDGSLTVLPMINVTQSFSDTNRNTANAITTTATDDKEPNNLQTYLKLYDSTTQQQENDERSKSLEIEIPQDDGNFGCPTPDILIKNYDSERYCRRVKPENRPDLLRNVSPNPPMKCRFEAAFMEDEDKQRQQQELQRSTERDSPPNTLCTDNKSDLGRDDISLGLTPVDIVGDFGQEVEREFGLIVSGYNSRLEFDSYPTGAFYLYNVAEAEKMSDALLSNGAEEIPIGKYTTDVDLVDLHQTRHRLPTQTEEDDAFALNKDQDTRMDEPEDEDHRSSDCMIPQSGPMSQNSCINSIPATCDRNLEENASLSPEQKIIPTAIVKPKYQKSSYDERQLPPIGLDFSIKSRAWFDCPSGSGSGSSNTRSTKKSQNDRNSKIYKSAKLARGNSSNSSSTSASTTVGRFGLPGRRMGNNNKGKIAVVQPMLKDPEGHQMMDNDDDVHGIEDDADCEAQQIVDNKPVEPHCTRYSFASWAASLRDSKRSSQRADEAGADSSACFDVYNIETALPEIDLDAIETHLKRANEEERRRRNDREEIRRRLAMGAEDDYFSKLVSNNVRPGRKPSLQSRLKNGKNLQICFTNEASSDTESHSSDSETCPKLSRMVARNTRTEAPKFFSTIDVPEHPYNANPLSVSCTNNNNNNNSRKSTQTSANVPQPDADADKECDFFTRQARLQIEARMALSQAKDMAHMQMELDRQKQRLSPITGIIRGSLEKVGVVMAPEKRRVSRQMLTDMNIAQLQIIVNELHTQIEDLNDSLVHYLMERDELHMGQDSMLVDIEDISRFLSAKELEDER